MQRTKNPGVTVARSSLSIAVASILALALSAPPVLPMPSQGESGGPNAAQAIVAYGFLRWGDLEFDQLVASSPNLTLVQNLRALDTALKALDCDVRNRMAMASQQYVTALAFAPMRHWIISPAPSAGSLGTWLFVLSPPGNSLRGTLVILATEGPSQTTVFWLKKVGRRYQTKLVFDSFKKGTISNDTTQMGTVTTIQFKSGNSLLLKDWGEPGIGPAEFTRVRRVFHLNLSTDVVTEVSSRTPGRR